MHLNYIGLQNFRVFKDFTAFDMAPITVLTGQNNSGKSSFNKALMTIYEAFEKQYDIGKISLNDIYEGVSNIDYFKNRESKEEPFVLEINIPFLDFEERCRVKLTYEETNQGSLILKELYVFTPNNEKLIHIKSFDETVDKGAWFEEKIKNGERISHADKILYDGFIANGKKWVEDVTCIDYQFNHEYFIKLMQKVRLELIDVLNNKFNLLSDDDKKSFENYNSNLHIDKLILNERISYKSYLPSKEIFEKSITSIEDLNCFGYLKIKNEDEIVKDYNFEKISEYIKFQGKSYGMFYENFNESKPTMSCPLLNLKISLLEINEFSYVENIDTKHTQFVLSPFMKMFEEEFITNSLKIISSISKSFKNIFYFSSHRSDNSAIDIYKAFHSSNFQYDSPSKSFLDFAFKQLNISNRLEIKNVDGVAKPYLVINNSNEEPLSNFGFGYSKIIPVILKIFLIANENLQIINGKQYPKEFLFILEEPEANLHPNLQSKLADIIVKAMNDFNIQFVIETHSEYFIRKLQYLTAKKELKPEDSVIYYFNPPNMKLEKGEKQIEQINIKKDGGLTNTFGSGFFDEANDIKMQLLKLNRSQSN